MPRYVIPLALVLGGATLLAVTTYRDAGFTVSSSPLGKPAPSFVLPTLREPERQVRLSDLTGRAVILNVWATWCVPCRQEHGMLLTMARSGKAPVYGLNYRDDRELAIRWLDELGNPFVETAFDARGDVAHQFGVAAVPETFVLDAHGVVVYRRAGAITPEVWRDEMLPVLSRLGASNTRE
ncbi:MAG: DsbE family thiol:disulfide interchange protein [Gammaproteobacteria bacterium]|nr:DsbE family thiol:disulfide interchange protein [Gammaproteobacteria bacterium]